MDIKKLDTELNDVIKELKINIETHEAIIKDTKKLGKEYNKYLTKVDTVLDNAEENAKNIMLIKEKAESAFNELSLENENVSKELEESKVIIKGAIKESAEMFNKVCELNEKIDMEKDKAVEKVTFIEDKKRNAGNMLEEVDNIVLSIKANQDNQTKLIEEYEKIRTKLNAKDEEMTQVIKIANEKVENMSKNYKDLNKTDFYLKISLIMGTISIICNIILFFRG